jgi:hypothetical protein
VLAMARAKAIAAVITQLRPNMAVTLKAKTESAVGSKVRRATIMLTTR